MEKSRKQAFQEVDALVDQVRPTKPAPHEDISAARLIELSQVIVDSGERPAIATLRDGELAELVAGYRMLMHIKARLRALDPTPKTGTEAGLHRGHR